MTKDFRNVYADEERASAYAGLEFPGTYYLAFRDLPTLFARHVHGRRALDFGCGAGRSSRFLKELGFEVTGVDIAEEMLCHARSRDPDGDYRLIPDGDFGALEAGTFDLVLSAFTFDNIPSREHRTALFTGFRHLLAERGRIVNVVSSPELYINDWVSFANADIALNRDARSGAPVQTIMLDVPDRRPVEDIYWDDADYRRLYAAAGLELLETHRPLGKAGDPYEWEREAELSPWSIYVAGPGGE